MSKRIKVLLVALSVVATLAISPTTWSQVNFNADQETQGVANQPESSEEVESHESEETAKDKEISDAEAITAGVAAGVSIEKNTVKVRYRGRTVIRNVHGPMSSINIGAAIIDYEGRAKELDLWIQKHEQTVEELANTPIIGETAATAITVTISGFAGERKGIDILVAKIYESQGIEAGASAQNYFVGRVEALKELEMRYQPLLSQIQSVDEANTTAVRKAEEEATAREEEAQTAEEEARRADLEAKMKRERANKEQRELEEKRQEEIDELKRRANEAEEKAKERKRQLEEERERREMTPTPTPMPTPTPTPEIPEVPETPRVQRPSMPQAGMVWDYGLETWVFPPPEQTTEPELPTTPPTPPEESPTPHEKESGGKILGLSYIEFGLGILVLLALVYILYSRFGRGRGGEKDGDPLVGNDEEDGSPPVVS